MRANAANLILYEHRYTNTQSSRAHREPHAKAQTPCYPDREHLFYIFKMEYKKERTKLNKKKKKNEDQWNELKKKPVLTVPCTAE